ncbi:Pleiotropic regulatory protein [Minicystis rosea]|nr:Pleiotropic regulatory protein [Minicystis rosea]
MPFFDRSRADAAIEGELLEAFQRVLRSGHYILGGEVIAFEQACAALLGTPHALGVSCGTDALVVALLALGVGPGDEVICPAYTFFATAGAVTRTGAVPVLVDVDRLSSNILPEAVAARVGPRTKAIVPVHLFGHAVDLAALRAAAGGVPIVEDAAQAMGATHEGRAVGTIGALGCFSFFPTKNLGGFGDGGLVVTGDAELAARARSLRVHGTREKHLHTDVGGNYRLDALQAALLRVKVPRLHDDLRARRAHATRYRQLLDAVDETRLSLPPEGGTFNQFVVRAHEPGARDRLKAFLAERGVGTEIYYPRPLHFQPALAHLGHREGDFPNAEAAARETLALPIFPELTEDEITYAAEQVAAFFTRPSP